MYAQSSPQAFGSLSDSEYGDVSGATKVEAVTYSTTVTKILGGSISVRTMPLAQANEGAPVLVTCSAECNKPAAENGSE